MFFPSMIFGSEEVKNLGIFYQWNGENSNYSGVPPYLIIRSYVEYEPFWKAHSQKEKMWNIDFEKAMLFVWAPGFTLFDFVPREIISFQKQGSGYVLLLNLEKKHSGGYWRKPYLMALLPRIETGTIKVCRGGKKSVGEPNFVTLNTFWNLLPQNLPSPEIVTLSKGKDRLRKSSEVKVEKSDEPKIPSKNDPNLESKASIGLKSSQSISEVASLTGMPEEKKTPSASAGPEENSFDDVFEMDK